MASLLSWIGNTAAGVERQVNPFDKGATYSKPAPQPSRQPAINSAAQQPHPSFLNQTVHNIGTQLQHSPVPNLTQQLPGVVNDFKAMAGIATGNRQATSHAVKQGINQFKGQIGNDVGQLRQFTTRPAVQVATTLAPRLAKNGTVTPTNPVSKALLGDTPVQNIQQGIRTTYRQHPGLPTPLRIGLAGAYGAGQIANDVPVLGAAKEGTMAAKEATIPTKFAGLTKNQVIMDTKKLDTLNAAKDFNHFDKGNSVKAAQDVISGLHQIKNDHGLDFISGSPAERQQRITQYLEQNGEAIPQLQAHQAKMAQLRNAAVNVQNKYAPGLRSNAVNNRGEAVGLNGKPLKTPVSSEGSVAPTETAASTTPSIQLPGAAKSAGKVPGRPAILGESGAQVKDTAISRFPQRLQEDPRTAPFNSTILQTITHDVKHNAPVLENTARKIAQNEDAALAFAKRGNSTEANATAMQLLEKYLSEGSHEKASELLQSIGPRFTRQGQETQILAAYSKTANPAGAVRYATKEVEKAAGKSANGLKLEDKTAQVHTAVKQTAKDVANQLSEEVRTGKVGKPSATKAVKTSKTPEEMLANRIKAPSDRKFTAQDPVKDMVATLHKVAKQVIPNAEKKLPRDPMELVGQAIKGKAEYAGVYDKAKALVLDKYKDNPAALAELEKYFGTDATRTYAQSQLNTGIQQGLKGTNLSKIVKEHYSKVDETGQELKQKLIERAGLSESEATQLSGDIQKRYDQLIATKKDSVIKQIFGDKPKPEQVQLADKILQYHNLGAMGRDELRPLVAKKLGLETLSPEASKTISDMAGHIQTLADGSPERLQATADMLRFIAEQKPQSVLDNTVGIYKAGLLSGVKTQEGNASSNSLFSGLKKVSDIPASVVDRGFALAGKTSVGKRIGLAGDRTIGLTVRGGISGGKVGFGKGLSIMKGKPEYTVGDKYEQHAEINLNNRVLQRVFGTPSNYIFRGMQAADQPFRYAALKNSLYDQAYAAGRNEGLSGGALRARAEQLAKNPTEQMAATAAKEAKKSVLDYDTYASRAIQAAHTGIDKMVENGGSPLGGKIANGALNILAPFVRVPSAFISRTVDFTPLGVGKEIGHQLFTKTFDQRALSQAIGEGLTGTGIIALGMHLSGQGQLSGDYPKTDPKEQQRWKTEGITPNSVKIGKSWKSLNYLGPIGLLFGVGKKIDEAKGSSNIEKTSQAIAGLGRGLLGQSFLQGLNGFSSAVQDPTKVGSYLNSEVSSIIPAWVNDIGNATDKLQRQADNVGEAVKGRLPGIRHGLNPKQDVYGNNLPNQASGLNAINGLKPSNDLTINNPVTSEVSRLHNVNPDDSNLQVTPTPVGKSISVEGTKVPLNDKQRYAIQKQTGQLLQSKWSDLIKTDAYKKMSDTQKAAALNNIRSLASEDATRSYIVSNNLGTYNKPESKKAVALNQKTDSIANLATSKATGGSTTTPSTDLYKSPDAEYKALQDKYNKATFNSPAAKIKATNELNRAKVGSAYDKSIRDAYNLSNAELYNYVSNDPNGKAIVEKVLAYSQALKDAGITSTAKFKNKYGQTTLGNSTVSSSRSGSTRRVSSGTRTAKATKIKSIKQPKALHLAAKGFKVKSPKAPSFRAKRVKLPSYAVKTPKVNKKAIA